MLTRAEIESLTIGDLIQTSCSDTREIIAGNAVWSAPVPVLSITFRGVSVKGMAYVGGYVPFGNSGTATISFSADETDHHVRMATAISHMDGLVGTVQRTFCGDSA